MEEAASTRAIKGLASSSEGTEMEEGAHGDMVLLLFRFRLLQNFVVDPIFKEEKIILQK
jgi:hypothetical protein